MSSSTLIMAIQHPQQSFGNYVSSDHHQYSDHGCQRLRPMNATGFAHSHISHGSSSTLPYGLPLQNFDLGESQYQNTFIDAHGYFTNANTSYAHKGTPRQNNYLASGTLSTNMSDSNGFQNSNIYSNNLSQHPEQIHQYHSNTFVVPNRPPVLFSSPENLRPHDQYSSPPPPGSGVGIAGVSNFIQQNQSAQNSHLNTPAALLHTGTLQSSTRRTSSKAAKSSSSNIPDSSTAPYPDTKYRPKNHACWMCNKCFDRPSTLRKHLLVHTGEKAFACNICGRRFGVASNMNRHARRCALKPVNALHNANSNTNAGVESGGNSQNEIVSPSSGGTTSSPSISPTVILPPYLSMVIPPSSLVRALGEPEGQSASPQSAIFNNDRPSPIMTPFSPTFAQRPMSVPAETTNVAIADKHPEAGTSGSSHRRRSNKTHKAASGSSAIISSGRTQVGGRPESLSPLLPLPSPSQVDYRTSSSSPTTNVNSQTQISEPKPKRRRRARSPSIWIPNSLIGFELDPVLPAASVPLPPVFPGNVDVNGVVEERDSYDEQVSHMPYHPSGWSGKLPGPALITTEDTNGKGSLTYKFMF